MTIAEQKIIKEEFDKAVKYFDKRGDKLTKEEVLQEMGALRMFLYKLTDFSK